MSTTETQRIRVSPTAPSRRLSRFFERAVESLAEEDPELLDILDAEYDRQARTLSMVASCSPAHPSTLVCEGSFLSNVTAEGYPGRRFHAGCVNIDAVERLAIERAKLAFGATYANVQPHTASTANLAVMTSLLSPGDTILGLDLDAGGHLSHGARVNFSGQMFRSVSYGLTPQGFIDYDQVRDRARQSSPALIVAGTTAYPRAIDFAAFRAIADEVGALLLADITHVAGLVVTGKHPSPIEHAHIVTTCTHKQLYGPRGGLILMGSSASAPAPKGGGTLEAAMQRGVFPLTHGAPIPGAIAAKARALGQATTPAFAVLMQRVVDLARCLARELVRHGVRVISGGTDNHIVVADVLSSFGVTGVVAEKALEECGIVVNKNRIVGDPKPATVTSGVRFGTNGMAARAIPEADMVRCAGLIVRLLAEVEPLDDRNYRIPETTRRELIVAVRSLCARHPVPDYER